MSTEIRFALVSKQYENLIAQQWADALERVIVRHPDRRSNAVLEITESAFVYLHVRLDRAWSTDDPEKSRAPFRIASVRLSFFPGKELAQKWLAAAWVGYLQHEALELTTVGDLKTRPLDPHMQLHPTSPYNRGLRDGFPVILDVVSLAGTFRILMDDREVLQMLKEPIQ